MLRRGNKLRCGCDLIIYCMKFNGAHGFECSRVYSFILQDFRVTLTSSNPLLSAVLSGERTRNALWGLEFCFLFSPRNRRITYFRNVICKYSNIYVNKKQMTLWDYHGYIIFKKVWKGTFNDNFKFIFDGGQYLWFLFCKIVHNLLHLEIYNEGRLSKNITTNDMISSFQLWAFNFLLVTF